MIVDEYDVEISFQGPIHFKNKAGTIEYWIMSEANSIFGE